MAPIREGRGQGHPGGKGQGGKGRGGQGGKGRGRQHNGDRRVPFPWINTQIISASEMGLEPLLQTITAHLMQMNLVNLSTAIHRLAKLTSNDMRAQAEMRQHPVLNELQGAISAALAGLEPGEAQPQSLSNVAWSLATMRLFNWPLVQVVASLAMANISMFKPFELSTMLWAFAKLGSADGRGEMSASSVRPFFHAAAAHIMRNLHEFGFRCLATTAWAFATARQRHARLFRGIASQMIPMVHVANCQEMANTAWAFGTADFHDDVLFTELAEKALLKLKDFKPQELSNMLWGFATNGFFHEDFFSRSVTVAKRMNLQAQHLANILWAFARVQPRHPATQSTILSLLPHCTAQLESFKPQEVSSTALAVAKAFASGEGHAPKRGSPQACGAPGASATPCGRDGGLPPTQIPPVVAEFFVAVIPWAMHRLREFSVQSLANMVSAYAMVNLAGAGPLFISIGREVMGRYDKLDATALVHLLKGFSSAPPEAGTGKIFGALAAKLSSHVEELRPQELQTLSRICAASLGASACRREASCEELRGYCLSLAAGCEAGWEPPHFSGHLDDFDAPPQTDLGQSPYSVLGHQASSYTDDIDEVCLGKGVNGKGMGGGPPPHMGGGPPPLMGKGPPSLMGKGPPPLMGEGPPPLMGKGPPPQMGDVPPPQMGKGLPPQMGRWDGEGDPRELWPPMGAGGGGCLTSDGSSSPYEIADVLDGGSDPNAFPGGERRGGKSTKQRGGKQVTCASTWRNPAGDSQDGHMVSIDEFPTYTPCASMTSPASFQQFDPPPPLLAATSPTVSPAAPMPQLAFEDRDSFARSRQRIPEWQFTCSVKNSFLHFEDQQSGDEDCESDGASRRSSSVPSRFREEHVDDWHRRNPDHRIAHEQEQVDWANHSSGVGNLDFDWGVPERRPASTPDSMFTRENEPTRGPLAAQLAACSTQEAGAMSPEGIPPGALLPGVMPLGAMPPGALPPGAMPPEAMQPRGRQMDPDMAPMPPDVSTRGRQMPPEVAQNGGMPMPTSVVPLRGQQMPPEAMAASAMNMVHF